jgi:hypothetical protein
MHSDPTPLIALLPFVIFIPLALIGLALMVFWIWMLVDCATKEPSAGNEKIVWILVIIFTHWIGALIYFLVRRPQRKREHGS